MAKELHLSGLVVETFVDCGGEPVVCDKEIKLPISLGSLTHCDVTRTERGWPGHYCCAHECCFHRNTLLECPTTGTFIVVSTVGNRQSPNGCGTNTDLNVREIAPGCFYETLAFHAAATSRSDSDVVYMDADVSREVSGRHSLPFRVNEFNFASDMKANAMHEKIVEWFAAEMGRGEKFEIAGQAEGEVEGEVPE